MALLGLVTAQWSTGSKITQRTYFDLKQNLRLDSMHSKNRTIHDFDDTSSRTLSNIKEVPEKSVSELEDNIEALLNTAAEHFDHYLEERIDSSSGIGIIGEDYFIATS